MSRSGSNSHRRLSHEPSEDFPPPSSTLPPTSLPGLRSMMLDREWARQGPSYRLRPNASRRAMRIHNMALQDFESPDPWAAGGRLERIRSGDSRPGSGNFDELDRSLEEANSHLRALLNINEPHDLTSPVVPPENPPQAASRPQDLPDDNRRHKRRKLDADRLAPERRGFRYGRYGQVEPGELRMEMVSCDGGNFSNGVSYSAENILKNDSSVYCTKGIRCNIVLRHQASAVFTLSELVIKAPASMDYSHPVREGMVFVAMSQDNLLSRTAQYQIQYSQNDPAKANEPAPTVTVLNRRTGEAAVYPRRAYPLFEEFHFDVRTPLMPHEFTRNLPEFRVTTEYSDDEDEEPFDPYSVPMRERFARTTRNHIGSLPFENFDSDSDGSPFGPESAYLDDSDLQWRYYNSPSQAHHQARSSSLAQAREASAVATQEAVRAVGGELLTPHARFFIEKKKSKCTIRFDPPVSGRFILLKMWSSEYDSTSNIDIQSVIARGFAGPRYLPSVEAR